MPQVRDPKTGRYTSGSGSSVGGAAGTTADGDADYGTVVVHYPRK